MSAGRLGFISGLIGLVVTGSIAWTARALNRSNEHRRLQVQKAQAGAVISSSILGIEAPLATALQTETVTGGDPGQFARFMSAYTGSGQQFVSASVWQVEGSARVWSRPLAFRWLDPELPDPIVIAASGSRV